MREMKKRNRTRPLLLILAIFLLASILIQLRLVHELDESISVKNPFSKELSKSPACNPHSKVAVPLNSVVPPSDIQVLNGHAHPLISLSWNSTRPFTRIYFYHIRKSGGTMIRKYLKAVASHYSIDLTIQENKYAKEEVGSVPGTFYVTNLRDPVERSISHFKYEGRWDCKQLVKNHSFVPTKANARRFEDWKETNGFVSSDCDDPFSFTNCAVNCYVQSFSGEGCTNDGWISEYRLAKARLFRYNLIFVYEKFQDTNYIQAIETFFGVSGFNKASDMWCGAQAHKANKKIPLVVGFEHVMKLTKLNEIDIRLYKETALCDDWANGKYAFGSKGSVLFVGHENRTIIGS